jgi:hypothetical protein
LNHSFSLGTNVMAPGLRVIVSFAMPAGAIVYAPVSVLAVPWPLSSQFAKRTASQKET